MGHLFAYREPRLAFALAAALTGLVVSFVMVHFGGPNARYLPVGSFHVSALVGAGLAGWIFAGVASTGGRNTLIFRKRWSVGNEVSYQDLLFS
jgi:hypothetical protein